MTEWQRGPHTQKPAGHPAALTWLQLPSREGGFSSGKKKLMKEVGCEMRVKVVNRGESTSKEGGCVSGKTLSHTG